MHNLLGTNYKWWYILKFKFRGRTVSPLDNAMFVFGNLVILTSTLIIWWIANDKIIDDSLKVKWTYFIIGELFFNIIFTFAEFNAYDILRGTHVSKLLKPQNYFLLEFFETNGDALLQKIIKTLILTMILAVAISTNVLSEFRFDTFLISLLMIPIAATILFLIGMVVGFSAFFLRQVNGIILNLGILSTLLMGRAFPLDLLFSNFYVHLFNPFAFIFYHPMQIYLNKYNLEQTLIVFVSEIIWCVALTILAKFVYKSGLKRNESVGL